MEQVEKQREEAARLGREMEDLQVHLLPPSFVHISLKTGHLCVLNVFVHALKVYVGHLQQSCSAVHVSRAADVLFRLCCNFLMRPLMKPQAGPWPPDFFMLRYSTFAAGAG